MFGNNEYRTGRASALQYLKYVPLWLSIAGCLSVVFEFGFDASDQLSTQIRFIYNAVFLAGIASLFARYISRLRRPVLKVWFFDIVYLAVITSLLLQNANVHVHDLFEYPIWNYAMVFMVFIREFSTLKLTYDRRYLNPAQLFIAGFLIVIATGTALLLLPNSTHGGISLIDALFTSTSAVCVTGLIVEDTGSFFTPFGQTVILILIQIGGIGIMTFTSFFSHFFRGGSSYENQIVLSNMTNSDKMNEVFGTLRRIILLTFIIEAAGAMFIYMSLDETVMKDTAQSIFFSIFHSVSGFCNAGFSTLEHSLYEEPFRFNYGLHMIIAVLFVIGGMGFPIVFNFMQYLKHLVVNRLLPLRTQKHGKHIPWVINLNTRIVIITTMILLGSGTFLFYLFEYNNTLAEHSGIGKLVTAFFGAATPRTAGFNTVDTGMLNFHTIMIVFFLMWVGASPASTGGGLKTSTLALGTLNFFSVARGKDRIELFHREIPASSVRRAFAIISLSLIAVGTSVFFITLFDREKDLLSIAFECFSAYSTVGLSLGITSELSEPSKAVIIITMFTGRITMLTLLTAFLRNVKYLHYRYPSEDILIN